MINSKTIFLLFITICFGTIIHSQSLHEKIDEMLSAKYTADGTGAAALVAIDGAVVYRNAFGKANLELGVDMTPDNVFEIGSITKQFTTVGILMLMEEGKLSLTDDITKYIPDYPTHGKSITLHHLLNHTSGIKSYTSMPSFRRVARRDMTPTQLINFFKDEPMDFDPGEKYEYNNSAFVILGYVIEKVTGEDYEDFIEKRIFDKIGMADSRYGNDREIIKNRAPGYSRSAQGNTNADYLSMTLPYAAGSLMSTVDDLLKWQEAVSDNTFITETSKKLAWDNYTLNDGSKINYGYGWAPNDVNGTPSIEHGGSIPGYQSMGVYVPSHDAYVIVLTNNSANGPSDIAVKIAAEAIGSPYPAIDDRVALTDAQLEKWTGSYEFEDGAIRFVTLKDGQLYSKRQGGQTSVIYPSSDNTFFFDDGLITYRFEEGSDGKTAFFHNRIEQSKGKATDMEVPESKKTITLSADKLKEYIGKYELAPGFIIEISTVDDKIFAQATGQSQFEIFAESEDKFFLKNVEAETVFNRDDDGTVISMTLFQNGRVVPGKKIQ